MFRSTDMILRVGQYGGRVEEVEGVGQNSEDERSMGPERCSCVSVGSCDSVCRVRLRWSVVGDEGSRMLGGSKSWFIGASW